MMFEKLFSPPEAFLFVAALRLSPVLYSEPRTAWKHLVIEVKTCIEC